MPDTKSEFPLIAFIGVGTMAEAMVECALHGRWPRERLLLTHRRADRRAALKEKFGGAIGEDNLAAARAADVVTIGVRPQEVADMLKSLAPAFRAGQTLVSIAAALSLKWLHARVPAGMKVIRVTPPPTAWVSAGVTLISADDDIGPFERRMIEALMKTTCERFEWIADEITDPITGVALGLTPYTCMLLATLIKTGIEQGLDPVFVRKMVMEGIWATARMLKNGGMTPEEIIQTVATREGLTWSALHTMDAHGVPAGIRAGARAMTGRSYQLRGDEVPEEHKGFAT